MSLQGVTAALTLGLCACSPLLPRSESATQTSWKSYDEAKSAIESLTPGVSLRADLQELGIDPYSNAAVRILTYPDILQRFAVGAAVSAQNLDPGIRRCINAANHCIGYAIEQASISRKRYGNFWADQLNFRRKTDIEGWRFNAIIVIVSDVVVYAAYGGQPHVHEHESSRNPLGPLQDSGSTVIMRPIERQF